MWQTLDCKQQELVVLFNGLQLRYLWFVFCFFFILFCRSKVVNSEDHTMETVCGTWAYAAPEVLSHKPYTQKVDNWTLGVLMFILLSGYHPFDEYGDMPEPLLIKVM